MKSKPPAPDATPATRPLRRRRRWLALIVVVVLLLSLAGTAPQLVTRFVLPAIMARSGEVVHGSVEYESASFGWTTPLSLRGLVARDLEGEQLAEIVEIRTELSLWRLIRSRSDLGTLVIDQPKLRIVAGVGPSNLEKFLEPILSAPASKEPLAVAWQVRNGEAKILDGANGKTISTIVLERVDGSMKRGSDTQLTLDVAAQTHVGQRTGRLEFALKTSEDADQRRGGDLLATLTDIPLEILEPIWPRIEAPLTLVGVCNGQIQGQIRPGNEGEISWRDLRATQLSVHAPAALGDDTIACEQLLSGGNVSWTPEEWHATLNAESDYGTTHLLANSVAAGRASVVTRTFAGGNLEFDADLDLARLARSLPRTLRLQEQVRIESGRAKIHVDSHAEANDTRWNASLETSDFIAQHEDTRIVWQSPINAQLAARWSNEHWHVDELRCQSEFLSTRLEGTADEATVRLDADLAKLAARLNEFFQLPAELRGRIEGQVNWHRHPPDVMADAVLDVNDFVCNLPGQPAWKEPAMQLTVRANARHTPEGAWSELRELRAELTARPDHLVMTLVEPLALSNLAAGVTVDLHWQGELNSWQERLGPFLPMDGTTTNGTLDVKGQAFLSRNSIRIDQLDGEIQQLKIRSPQLQIDEPRITVNVQGLLDLQKKNFSTKHSELASSVVALRADDVDVSWDPAQPSTGGTLEFRSDLSRLRTWLPTVSVATPHWATKGELVGRATLASPLQVEGEIRNFQVYEDLQPAAQPAPQNVSTGSLPPTVLWDEPLVSFLARGQWKPGGEATLDQFDISATGLHLAATGKISDLQATPRLQLDGSLDYDWAPHDERLKRLLGQSFAVQGKRTDTIQLTGLLTSEHSTAIPPSLRGNAGIGWDAISYYGIDVGKGATNAALQDAVLKISALDIPVSGGMLKAEPQVDLRGEIPLLTIPPGVLLDQVRISPEMCRTWLKYVAPLVANATRAEGTFSMQLDRLQVPLGHPEKADVAGALVVQEATIGPGPLAQTIISIVDRLSAVAESRVPRLGALSGDTWLKMPAQVVAFEVQNGRVLHRELRMQVKDVTVVTRGWVAVDQSMQLDVEIPVPDKWVNANRLLEGLRGKTITVPVRGTLDKPEFDERVLGELTKGLLGNAAEKLLEDQLRKGLNQLFRRP